MTAQHSRGINCVPIGSIQSKSEQVSTACNGHWLEIGRTPPPYIVCVVHVFAFCCGCVYVLRNGEIPLACDIIAVWPFALRHDTDNLLQPTNTRLLPGGLSRQCGIIIQRSKRMRKPVNLSRSNYVCHCESVADFNQQHCQRARR